MFLHNYQFFLLLILFARLLPSVRIYVRFLWVHYVCALLLIIHFDGEQFQLSWRIQCVRKPFDIRFGAYGSEKMRFAELKVSVRAFAFELFRPSWRLKLLFNRCFSIRVDEFICSVCALGAYVSICHFSREREKNTCRGFDCCCFHLNRVEKKSRKR